MQIKTISYGLTKHLGNSQSERLDVTVQLQDGDQLEASFLKLKSTVHELLQIPEENDSEIPY